MPFLILIKPLKEFYETGNRRLTPNSEHRCLVEIGKQNGPTAGV